jgi:hypothetical protein
MIKRLGGFFQWVGWVAALLVASSVFPAFCSEAQAQTDIDISGYLSTQYRYRATEEDSDQDVYQYIDLNIGNPISDKATAHLFARGSVDIDGKQDYEGYYIFDSVDDTYDNNYTGRLYSAYIDIHRVRGLDTVRFGRQLYHGAPISLYFDGGRIETAEVKEFISFKFGTYGGVPVHLYEPDQEGNAIYGSFIQTRPWPRARFLFNWTHVDNEYLYGEENNDFYSAEYWQSVTDHFRYHAAYTHLDDDPRDASGDLTLTTPDGNFIIQGRYYELLETQNFYAIDFDPFYAPLQQLEPYWQASGLIYAGLGENLAVEGGVDGRKLKDEDDESAFNHEFLRYFVTVMGGDLGTDGLEASASYESWDSYTREEEIRAVGGDITYKAADRSRVSVGTDYSLYKYDYYLDEERDQVRTYYARIKWYVVDSFRMDLAYEYEEDDFDIYHWAKINLRYEFGREK